MKNKSIVILGASVIGLGALGIYTKKQYDMVVNDLDYGYDKSSIKVNTAQINRVALNMDFTIKNRGKLDFEAKDLRLKIASKDVLVSEVYNTGTFNIRPNSTSPVNIDVFLNPEEIIRSRKDINILNWKEIPLTFKGSIKIKRAGIWIPIPFKFTYKLGEFV